ncbi:MAG: TIGR02646 family protein [Acidobacteria bacterium]|nr:TIGR02646 family protein [Acidobacteriota bacterium]
MRTIHKLPEPAFLTYFRLQPNASYASFPHKPALRFTLVKEQRGLCCYCLSRIRDHENSATIEHWHSQHGFPSETLTYSNLLAVCKGGQFSREQHCDRVKGDRELSLNPADPLHNVESLVRYEGSGRVSSQNQEVDKELNELLNLNAESLIAKRKAVLHALQQSLPTHPSKKWLHRQLEYWNGGTPGELPEFCQVVVYWLTKRISRS